MNALYTWNTTKTGSTFTWSVSKGTPSKVQNKNGSYLELAAIKTGSCSTRAKAMSQAKKWKKYLKNTCA